MAVISTVVRAQPTLHQAAVDRLDGLAADDFKICRQHPTTETAHGRTVTRCYVQVGVSKGLAEAEKWQCPAPRKMSQQL